MCFHSQQSKSATELQHRFKAKFRKPESYQAGVYNGFNHPYTPVIANEDMAHIELYQWGLIPTWAKDTRFQKNTLNARVESISEKASFKDIEHHRCLVLADAFFEWQWLDAGGKRKKKYTLQMPDGEAFAFAGLWSTWIDPIQGQTRHTYTILTTEANALMSEIHNSKKRMPLILESGYEMQWLQGNEGIWGNERLRAVAESTWSLF